MEFKLISPKNDSGFVKAIEFNFDELQTELKSNLEKFQNLVYTDENVGEAKKDRASLNKFKDAIESERKRIKNLCLAPYNDFEKKVKILTGLIDEPIKAIDTQVKTYEQRKKDAKLQEITQFYIDNVGDLDNLLQFSKIFNPKWLNAGTSFKSVCDEIMKILDKTRSDIKIIKDSKSEWELTLIDTYLNTLDISAALAEKTRLEERKKLLEEKEAEARVEKVTEEVFHEEPANKEITATEEVVVSKEENTIKIYERKFWVKGTADQLRALGKYMKENGIEYGGINE